MKIILIKVLIILMLSSSISYSQITNTNQPQGKIALVIGNGSYISSELANPENDARGMEIALQNVGFTVLKYENLSQVQMKKAIDDFGMKLKSYEVGLFFYAGHGIQSKGYNYLIPVDAQLQSEQQVEYDCVQADRILALMEASGTKVNIIILDACRNNPFERSWTRTATGRGLAFMNAPSGTLIAYATSPGSTASDGSGNNGLYTSAILESIQIPNITIIQMFQNVRSIVSQKSGKQQIPWESTSMTGDFYFNNNEIVGSKIQDKIQEAQLTEIKTTDEKDFFVDPNDNQRYEIVKIGNQIWMAENLKSLQLNDGAAIQLVTNNKEWSRLKTPGYCWYNNDGANDTNKFGAIYNWYTVNTGKLCPSGWHVPSDAEWWVLIDFLGKPEEVGGVLKESGTTHWARPNNGASNQSKFTALPGGYRDFSNGSFSYIGNYGYWWSATEAGDASSAFYRNMLYNNATINRGEGHKKSGLSVRCIKD